MQHSTATLAQRHHRFIHILSSYAYQLPFITQPYNDDSNEYYAEQLLTNEIYINECFGDWH